MGAVSAWTSTPAAPNPPSSASELLACSLLFPSTNASGATSDGRYER